jgi:glycosyltransferase involved in cell wall biosynthesis
MHTVLSKKEKFEGSKLKTFLRKKLYLFQNKWVSLTCKKIIVHTEVFKKILIKEYNIPAEKIDVFPHSIIENIKITDKEIAKKKLGLSGKVFLLIGTMIPDHGHDTIISQANKIGGTILVATNPAAVNDRNENKIKNFLELNEKIVDESNFQKMVRFDLGFISNEKWWEYFSAADLVLLPYKGGIGSGIFADAMAAKKPVVASNVKYFKDFASNYGCLKLAKKNGDFPEVIKECMKPKNYKKMINECERFFLENGLTPISKKYKFFYNSIK